MSNCDAPRYGAIDARSKGRLGELLAAIALEESCGVDAMFVDRNGYDIIGNCPRLGLLRIEVKSSHKTGADKERRVYNFCTSSGSKKRYHIDTNKVDIVALVAVPERSVIFKTAHSLRNRKTVKLRPSAFQQADVEANTWDEAVKFFLGNK